jgi:hypothetical protein
MENRLFLQTGLLESASDADSLRPFKDIIEQNMYLGDFGDEISLKSARKSISDYRKASGDENGVLELMIYYLEIGTKCTVDHGDMWESFYDSLISVGKQIVKKIRSGKVDKSIVDSIKPRFRKLRDDASGIGWSFGDDMAEIYYELFGD